MSVEVTAGSSGIARVRQLFLNVCLSRLEKALQRVVEIDDGIFGIVGIGDHDARCQLVSNRGLLATGSLRTNRSSIQIIISCALLQQSQDDQREQTGIGSRQSQVSNRKKPRIFKPLFLNAAAQTFSAATNGSNSRARNLHKTDLGHQIDEPVDLARAARQLEDKALKRCVLRCGPERLGKA
jgi:hypothetical protein